MSTETVQTLQNEHQPGVCLVKESKRTIPDTVLSLEGRILVMKRIDLYNKSRMSREVQVRFCACTPKCSGTQV